MKKLFIALFTFMAVFAFAGSVSAMDNYSDLEIDVETDTYACGLSSGVIDCWKDVGGTVTKWNDIAATAIIQDIVGIKKVGDTDLQVYYTQYNFASPSNYNLKKLVLNTSTGAIDSDVTYLDSATDHYYALGAISKNIPQSATNPAIAWIDSASGAVKIDVDETVYTTTSNGGSLENIGLKFLDVEASTTSGIVAVAYHDFVSTDLAVNNYNTATTTDDKLTVSSNLPESQDHIVLTQLDSTYAKAVVAYEEATSNDIYLAYSTDGSAYTNTVVVSRTNAAIDMDATAEGTDVAIAYSTGGDDPDDFRAVVVTDNAVGVRTDVSLDNAYLTYDQVAVDQNGSNDLVAMVEADEQSLDSFTYNGLTYDALNFEQQDEGSSVPELPGNTLWKVLIAILALGSVVGIAAFMKKKKK